MCTPLGIWHNHDWAGCFANPAAPGYSAATRQKRVALFHEMGLPLPDCLLPPPPTATTAAATAGSAQAPLAAAATSTRGPTALGAPVVARAREATREDIEGLLPGLLRAVSQADPKGALRDLLAAEGYRLPGAPDTPPSGAFMFIHCEDERDHQAAEAAFGSTEAEGPLSDRGEPSVGSLAWSRGRARGHAERVVEELELQAAQAEPAG